MITSQQPVVLTSSSVEAGSEEAVAANVRVVDAMHAALLHLEEMSPAAVRSYYVDFYLSQALEGGFAQYVFAAGDRAETDTLIREGMAGMGRRPTWTSSTAPSKRTTACPTKMQCTTWTAPRTCGKRSRRRPPDGGARRRVRGTAGT